MESKSRRRPMLRLLRRPLILIGGGLVLGTVLVGALAPLLAPYPADRVSARARDDLAHAFEGPSWKHPFGRDVNGRDELSRIIYGTRVSLLVGLVVVTVTAIIGVFLGAVAGYRGGWLDELL